MSTARAAAVALACAALAWLVASRAHDGARAERAEGASEGAAVGALEGGEVREGAPSVVVAAQGARPESAAATRTATSTSTSTSTIASTSTTASAEEGLGADPLAAYIIGHVVEGDDKRPVAGAIVEVGSDLDPLSRRIEATTTTAGDGAFMLGPLAPRLARVQVVARSGAGRSLPDYITVPRPGRYDKGDLGIVPGTVIRGRVLWPDGGPVTYAAIALEGPDGVRFQGDPGRAWAEADAAGEFAIAGVRPGDYLVLASDRDTGDEGRAHAHTGDDGTPVEVEVRLAPGAAEATARVRIVVAAPGGEPVPGAAVLVCGLPELSEHETALQEVAPSALETAAPPDVARLAGAVAWLPPPEAEDARRSKPHVLVTGPDGWVEVRLRRAPLWFLALAAAREGAPFGLGGEAHATPGLGPPSITVPLRPLGTLDGLVAETGSSGGPPEVLLASPAIRARRGIHAVGTRFEFGALPAGTYAVGVLRTPLTARSSGVPGFPSVRVEVREGEAAQVSLAAADRAEVLVRLAQAGGPADRLRHGIVTWVHGEVGYVAFDRFPDGSDAFPLHLLPGAYTFEVRGFTSREVLVAAHGAARVPEQAEVVVAVPAAGALRVRCAHGVVLPSGPGPRMRLASSEREVICDSDPVPDGESGAALLEGIPAGRYALGLDGFTFDPPEVAIPEGGVAEVTANRSAPPPGAGGR